MKFTKEAPNKEGFYFLRSKTLKQNFVVELFSINFENNPVMRVLSNFGDNDVGDFGADWLWAGPIPEPEDESFI